MHAARKITWTLFAGQALSSTGFLASATVTSIVGAELSGRAEWAGVPAAVYQLGVAASSLALGHLMDRVGRRRSLAAFFAIGAVGAAIAAWAIVTRTFVGFLFGLTLMGPANAAAALSRFVAAEVHPADKRGRAIANVVIGGTAGTLVWPILSVTLGPWLASKGASDVTWPYLVSMALLASTSIVMSAFLRPDPREIAREIAQNDRLASRVATNASGAPSLVTILLRPGVVVAMASMMAGHAVMVMIMVITSLHMRHHDHSVPAISLTTSLHVLGMFAFSILSGRLADKIGRAPVIAIGGIVLILACIVAPLSPAFGPITFGLFLLGLGWNFAFVGASSLLADQLSPDERARTQGFNDLLLGLVAAAGSFLSGHVFAAVGYGTMGIISAGVAVIPVALAIRWRWRRSTQLDTDSLDATSRP